jgi:rare lipoprotein A
MLRRFRPQTLFSALMIASLASACGAQSNSSHLVDRDYPAPAITSRGTEIGVASWYGPGFHGKLTADGTRYDQHGMTAAHRTLPLGTRVKVTDLASGHEVVVLVNDRGPYKVGRSIDLSYAAAQKIGMIERGTARVEIRMLDDQYAAWPSIRYSVQVGAFSRKQDADRVGRRLADFGERAYLKRSGRIGAGYIVRVGPYRRRTDALTAADRLHRGGFSTLVVEENPPKTASLSGSNGRSRTR